MIYYDRKTKCYTDGQRYVHASQIRDFAASRLGYSKDRGRLSRDTIAAYFLDTFGISEEVA